MVPPGHDDAPEPRTAQTLFWEVLERPADQRLAWLDAQPVDAALREEVRSLLTYHQTRDGRLDRPAVERPTFAGEDTLADAARPPPERLGDYEVVSVLASGGMGTVYEARQASPSRAVAIKVLQRSAAWDAARRRFAFEAEALARLRHPAIAQIHEAVLPGQDSDEQPFLVMELVPDARPITRYASEVGLARGELLELFCQVCDAVHHGHQRGVIHRDLKPGNILVNGEGQPKLIDFGVARLEDRREAGHTQAGQVLGTLAYMAPEQIDGAPDDLDIRADVHALGVVLFELLAGRLPVEVEGLPISQASRLLVEGDPPPPSRHDPSLRGDLDTIVQTAMARDRERRYASAAALADDVRRHLEHLPLDARPPRLTDLLARFARRRRGLVTGLAVALVTLLAASGVSIHFGLSEGRARREAEDARQEALQAQEEEASARRQAEQARREEALARGQAEQARDEALAQRTEAEHQRAEAERLRALADAAQTLAEDEARALAGVLDFFVGDVLTLADASRHEGEVLTVSQAVDRAEARMARRPFADDPRLEAGVLQGLGSIRSNLGQHEQAVPLLERAVALRQEQPDLAPELLAVSLSALAIALQGRGDLPAARALVDEALDLAARDPEPLRHVRLLLVAASLARDEGRLDLGLDQVATIRELLTGTQQPLDDELLSCAILEASLLELSGEGRRALDVLTVPLAALIQTESQDSLAWLRVSRPLAALLSRLGDPRSALGILEHVHRHAVRLFGPRHEAVARCLNSMGTAHYRMSEMRQAARRLDEAIELYVETLGPEHGATLVARGNRAAVALDTEDWSSARVQLEESLRQLDAQGLLDGVDGLRTRAFLGQVLLRQDEPEEAEAQLLAAWDQARDAPGRLGYELRQLIVPRLRLLYSETGRPDEADRWHDREDEFARPYDGD